VGRRRDAISRFAEACTAASPSPRDWCDRVTRAARPLFSACGGVGSFGCLLDEDSVIEEVVGHDPVGAVAGYSWERAVEALRPALGFDAATPFEVVGAEVARRLQGFRTSLMSQRFGRSNLAGALDRIAGTHSGARDAVLVRAGGHRAVMLGTALVDHTWDARDWPIIFAMHRQLQRAAPARLQLSQPDDADAIAAPRGDILALRGAADPAALGAAVAALERVRAGRDTQGQAERIWEEVLQGKWTCVEHIESDGRRLLLLGKNETRRVHERITRAEGSVLRRARRGLSNKRIAIELGVAETTVSAHLASALLKLGFESAAELIRWTARRSAGVKAAHRNE
jgi:DNA-binding CsgD family transcriptional regulator